MTDVASLLLEIETAQQKKPQLLGSLFDNDDDDEDEEDLTDLSSLCIIGRSCIIHSSNNDEILRDKYDARHKLSKFDIKDIESTQQRLKSNKIIYDKQWEEDKEWHLRNEKLLLIQENAAYTINDLQHERYRDFKDKMDKNRQKTGKLE